MRIEPSLVISSQSGTVGEDGEEIEGNVHYETDAEKRTRISQREWRQLENFLRFTQYYSGDIRMGSLVARYIARNEAVTQGNAFFASISQGLSTRASNFKVWNFQRGGGTLSVSLVGLSEYLVPNNDPNRDICANTNRDQTWAASTQACDALIWTANQNAVYHQARERALVAQRDALRNRVNTHISYELLGGAMLAGLTTAGAFWLRARVRASTERELTERIREQERASLFAEMGESLRG